MAQAFHYLAGQQDIGHQHQATVLQKKLFARLYDMVHTIDSIGSTLINPARKERNHSTIILFPYFHIIRDKTLIGSDGSSGTEL